MTSQQQKAEKLRALHHTGKLLVLPNIWNVLGAKLLEQEGFPAVATASAAVAYANGYNDGEEIPFAHVLHILSEICTSTSLPVTADIERGYAETPEKLAENIRQVITCGVAGINYEDSWKECRMMMTIEAQCENIKLIRRIADAMGVPLVINARTDVFFCTAFEGNRTEEAIRRGHAYKEAGADCFYPILCDNKALKELRSGLDIPINVLATKDTLPMQELERMGIARLSLGPALLKAVVGRMKEVFAALKNAEGYDTFTHAGLPTSKEIVQILKIKYL